MILESLTDVKNGKYKKNIFVIKLTNKNITIGKNDNNDIIDKSNAISGIHAILKFDEKRGNVTLINKGRYGTSILIKSNVKLQIGQKIYFQVGRTYIKAEVKEDDSEDEDSEGD